MVLRREITAPIARLTVARSEAKNAINPELATALIDGFVAAGAETEVRAVLLLAEGDVFLAGGDVKVLHAMGYGEDGARAVLELGEQLVGAIEDCPVPVVAAVGGAVFGGGAELLMACDAVVMAEDVSLRFVHAAMGLVPAWGGATRLVERVGVTRATELLLTARPVDGAEALRIGLAAQTSPPGEVVATAEAMVGAMVRHERASLVAMKRSLLGLRKARRGRAMAEEAAVFRDVWGEAPHRAAFARFIDRG